MQNIALEQIPLQMKKFSERSMLFIGFSAALLLVFNYVSWRSDTYENAPALDQIMEVKVQLMSSHLLFEEMVNGYIKVAHEEVHKSIEQTHQMVENSLKGMAQIGETYGSIPDDAALNSHLVLLHEIMHLIIDSKDEGGLQEDHDQLFKQAMLSAEAADERMHNLIAEKLEQQQLVFSTLLVSWLFILAFLVWHWRRISANFSKVNDKLNKLSHAVEQTGESMLISDRHGIIEYVNPAFTKITGYDSEDVLGNNPSLLSSGLQDSEFYQKMWSLILEGKVWRGEVVDKRKDGSLYRADMSISPIRGDSGEVSHFVAIQRDITELRDTQESLIQAQKMDAIGTMCCGLAHDMNNSLAVVIGNIEMARMDEELNEDVKELLVQAESAGFMAASMIGELLMFSSKGTLSLEPLNLKKTVEQIQIIMQPLSGQVNIELEAGMETSFILGDDRKLHRILINLIKNACDALEETKSPRININLATISHGEMKNIQQEESFSTAEWVRLSVSDNGPGIPQGLHEKVFDPFFTTKEVGKGTGLGLSSAYGIMQSHNGFIDIDSIEGKGTTFHLYFPSAMSGAS